VHIQPFVTKLKASSLEFMHRVETVNLSDLLPLSLIHINQASEIFSLMSATLIPCTMAVCTDNAQDISNQLLTIASHGLNHLQLDPLLLRPYTFLANLAESSTYRRNVATAIISSQVNLDMISKSSGLLQRFSDTLQAAHDTSDALQRRLNPTYCGSYCNHNKGVMTIFSNGEEARGLGKHLKWGKQEEFDRFVRSIGTESKLLSNDQVQGAEACPAIAAIFGEQLPDLEEFDEDQFLGTLAESAQTNLKYHMKGKSQPSSSSSSDRSSNWRSPPHSVYEVEDEEGVEGEQVDKEDTAMDTLDILAANNTCSCADWALNHQHSQLYYLSNKYNRTALSLAQACKLMRPVTSCKVSSSLVWDVRAMVVELLAKSSIGQTVSAEKLWAHGDLMDQLEDNVKSWHSPTDERINELMERIGDLNNLTANQIHILQAVSSVIDQYGATEVDELDIDTAARYVLIASNNLKEGQHKEA
jgi:hypothetical protein